MAAKILVVDDLLPNRRLLEAKLKGGYYNVDTAESGQEAIDKAIANPPDVILLDVMMPEMDGFEACRILKKNPITSDVPVVMVTALSDVEDRVQGLNSGADDFLTKPINDLALFARIRSLVRLKSMTDELKLRDQTGEKLGAEDPRRDIENNLAGSNVLIIDDDAAQAQQISTKLSEINVNAIVIGNPPDAVRRSEEQSFDLIMVSAQLSSDDGINLCTHLRSQDKTRNTPLLIIIEDDKPELLVKALDLGVNDYLVTPIDSNEVIARVKIQVRRKKYQDALQANQQQSLEMAVRDGLTGLYNRRYFDTHVERMLESSKENGKPLSLMILDMDHFKHVNDTYGHQSGDEILKQLSDRIMKSVRPSDLVARYGGEEFVVVMPSTNLKNSSIVGERIRKVIEAYPFSIPVEPGEIKKTISVGLAVSTPDDKVEQVVERADKALYHVKNTGRNKVAVYSERPL
ncbi:MAG: PleD family two-component system response regulator [Rickettsiales bacterium]|nr:PleD family two-component system response regulator [Pseudomonadota bacterium]MDA0965453.1 PleD family two-component system response regulator [Pseudomonadota bacterium]MDG4542778.1 PleD family two-component system response regulator [Rickettsiales bacterium]MDG4544774.1 PleD family two-component system response regulator [Rickettsiales bacterium]MDG4546896.1 PleD family two-component system response regulator [Rickettsiales bacterium]